MATKKTKPSNVSLNKNSKLSLLVFGVVFALVGGAVVWHSHAQSPLATTLIKTIEVESMKLPAGAKVVANKSASAGKAVEFSKGGSASSSFYLTGGIDANEMDVVGYSVMTCRKPKPGEVYPAYQTTASTVTPAIDQKSLTPAVISSDNKLWKIIPFSVSIYGGPSGPGILNDAIQLHPLSLDVYTGVGPLCTSKVYLDRVSFLGV